jgi:hypothetical protein
MNKSKTVKDILFLPFIYPAAYLLKKIRKTGIHRLPRCKNALLDSGVFPILNHYYEPQFDYRDSGKNFSEERTLNGIEWNIPEQIEMLENFRYSEELLKFPQERPETLAFYFKNDAFGPGDAEYWYQLIRFLKPKRIFEIGSGNSTLMAINAIHRNKSEDPGYRCKHVCIEPYEMPWLEKTSVTVIRKKVEEVDLSFFSELKHNDILFIDSSHIIRPHGDVCFEYLEILPSLNKGVVVHIHDIFSPRHYPEKWIKDQILFWNEQYLLEAFISHNSDWKIIGAVNYLHHNHYSKLKKVAPFLTQDREPGSFYIQRIKPAHDEGLSG